jgi:hypothetical protein
MTNETTMVNTTLLEAAKYDCQKRKDREQRKQEFKQSMCWFLIISTVLLVILSKSYPELGKPTNTKTANAIVTKIDNYTNIADDDSNTQTQNETTPFYPYSETITEVVTKEVEENIEKEENDITSSYSISDAEIDLLVKAVQHETGANPDFYPYGDYDVIQQYMAASIINRIGQPGFGDGYTTPNSLYEVLANPVQYGNMIYELDWYDANDTRTRNNVMAVLSGYVYTPENLYFERCSEVGEEYWSAQDSFYNQYREDASVSIYYMAPTLEGRYIIFAMNPNGAY